MFGTIFKLAKTAIRGKKTIITALSIVGLGGAVATDVVSIHDPYTQAVALVLLALSVIFQRLGAKNEKRDIFDALAEALKPKE